MTSASEQTRSWSLDLIDGKRFYSAGRNLQERRAPVAGSKHIEMFYSEEGVLALGRNNIEDTPRLFEGALRSSSMNIDKGNPE